MSGIVLTKPLIIASAVLCLGVGLVSYRTMDGANETVSNNMLTSANSGNDVANEYGKSSVYTENQGNSVEQQFWQLSDKLQGSEKSLSQLSERVSLIDREIERLKHVQSEAEVSPASLGGNEVANNSTADSRVSSPLRLRTRLGAIRRNKNSQALCSRYRACWKWEMSPVSQPCVASKGLTIRRKTDEMGRYRICIRFLGRARSMSSPTPIPVNWSSILPSRAMPCRVMAITAIQASRNRYCF